MIHSPKTLADAQKEIGEIRAGGTEIQERRRQGLSSGPILDLHKLPELRSMAATDEGARRIGALVTLDQLGEQEWLRQGYVGIAEAIDHIATPQIRRVATAGGNLLQKNRCWYYRQRTVDCYKKGGQSCPAREGNHLNGVCFDLGPCVSPHPSTLGVALLAYDATVRSIQQPSLPIEELWDHLDPSRDHCLSSDDVLLEVELPPPAPQEYAGYIRVAHRSSVAWPLIEMIVRIQGDESISFARIALGGAANIPLRLKRIEAFLIGQPFQLSVFEQAAALAACEANPLPATTYKVDILSGCLVELLSKLCLRETHFNASVGD